MRLIYSFSRSAGVAAILISSEGFGLSTASGRLQTLHRPTTFPAATRSLSLMAAHYSLEIQRAAKRDDENTDQGVPQFVSTVGSIVAAIGEYFDFLYMAFN